MASLPHCTWAAKKSSRLIGSMIGQQYKALNRGPISSHSMSHPHQMMISINKRSLSSSKQQNKSSPKSSWRHNGTPEILMGGTLVALLSVDQFFQYQQKNERQSMIQKLQDALDQDEKDSHDERQEEKEKLSKRDSLYSCVVRRMPKYFDGSQSLMNVNVGDIVHILEENVGPDGNYHYCRVVCRSGESDNALSDIDKRESELERIGWFPITCLERVKGD